MNDLWRISCAVCDYWGRWEWEGLHAMIRAFGLLLVLNKHCCSMVFVLSSQVLAKVRYVMGAFWDTGALTQTALHPCPASPGGNHGSNGNILLRPTASIQRRKCSKFIQSLPIARHTMSGGRCTIMLCRRTRMGYMRMMVIMLCGAAPAPSRCCPCRRVAFPGGSPMEG